MKSASSREQQEFQDDLKLFCYQLTALIPPQALFVPSVQHRHLLRPHPAWRQEHKATDMACPTLLSSSWYPEHSAQCQLPNPCHKKYFCNEWGSEGGSEEICCFMQHFLYVYLANRGKLFLFY